MRNKGISGAVPLSHFFLRERVRPGDRVVDATCGNGHDTLLLASLVGPSGRVWAFDVQEDALAATEARLLEAGRRDQVELVLAGHERLAEFVAGELCAVVFNLGYLPGGERGVATHPETTLAALRQSEKLLGPGGIIFLSVYTGHPGGPEEGAAVEAWGAALPPDRFNVWQCRQLNRSASAPYLVLAEKI